MMYLLAIAFIFNASILSTSTIAESWFVTFDLNQDGFVSFDELIAANFLTTNEAFRAADLNRDNLLDKLEFFSPILRSDN